LTRALSVDSTLSRPGTLVLSSLEQDENGHDAGRLLFITIIIMMIKTCYYQQAFILSRVALQFCAMMGSGENNSR